jgi:hypothetical protein
VVGRDCRVSIGSASLLSRPLPDVEKGRCVVDEVNVQFVTPSWHCEDMAHGQP